MMQSNNNPPAQGKATILNYLSQDWKHIWKLDARFAEYLRQ